MLEEFKEKKGSKLTYVVIGFLLVGMAGFGTQQFGQGDSLGNNSALSAGNIEISFNQYLNNLNRIKQENPDITEEQASQLSIDNLSKQVALSHYIEEYPLAISREELADVVQNNIAFFENGKYSSEAFKRNVSNAKAYLDNISAAHSVEILQEAIVNTAILSEAEQYPFDKLSELKNDVLIAKLNHSDYTANITDEAIKKYYTENKSQLLTDEKIAIKYIHFNPKTITEKLVLSEEEITNASKSAYQANYYLVKDKKVALSIYNQVKDGKSITEISDTSPELFEDQGSLGEVEREINDESLISQKALDAIYALDKVGDLTQPINVDDTIYLFELTKKTSEISSEAQKKQLIAQLKEKKAQPKIDDLNAKLNTLVFEENQTNLEEIAKATNLTVKSTKLEALNSPTSDVLLIQAVTDSIKSSNKGINKLQEPITTEDDQIILYQLSEYSPQREKTLNEAQLEIKNKLTSESINKKIHAKADEIIELAKKEEFDTVLSTQSISSELFNNFNEEVRTGQFKKNDLIDPISAFFITQKPINLGNENVAKIDGTNGDVFLYKTTAVRFKEEDKNDEKNEVKKEQLEQMSKSLGYSELTYFIQSITKNTDINVSGRLNDILLESQEEHL